ncbi:MAG: hypothetical protein HC836_38465 [Richelia sp. RM2_1_2]|nr:hypothetical protein [Richelia sp. RM2_1_2]
MYYRKLILLLPVEDELDGKFENFVFYQDENVTIKADFEFSETFLGLYIPNVGDYDIIIVRDTFKLTLPQVLGVFAHEVTHLLADFTSQVDQPLEANDVSSQEVHCYFMGYIMSKGSEFILENSIHKDEIKNK